MPNYVAADSYCQQHFSKDTHIVQNLLRIKPQACTSDGIIRFSK